MIKTYVITVADRAGSFAEAAEVFYGLGMNITRISYNKAVDIDNVFVDADGDEGRHRDAERILTKKGFCDTDHASRVELLRISMPDGAGQILRVLDVVHSFGISIPYISYVQQEGDVQSFKLAVRVDSDATFSCLLERIREIATAEVIDYDESEVNYDNSIFYESFVDNICFELKISARRKEEVMICCNMIMQNLDELGLPPYGAFMNISRCSELLSRSRKKNFDVRISEHQLSDGVSMTLLEPPCGSNVSILKSSDDILFIDTGYALYRREMTALLRKLVPEWDSIVKRVYVTHPDPDHCGLLDEFDEVLLNENSARCLMLEAEGRDGYREMNPMNRPYIKLCKIMTRYVPADTSKLRVMWEKRSESCDLFEKVGTFDFGDLHFDVLEGAGGHVKGESVLIDREHRLVFSGDIYINVKDQAPVQAEYNRCAPALLTTVDIDKDLCRREREQLISMLDEGDWRIFGGHGAVVEYASSNK
ncbi:MAG: MBL fold metallo-hydrolase [Eubacteriaceae bacterium]|nr:MBL fold metallo-hydrolase [Eubacteriaceae bacterium]